MTVAGACQVGGIARVGIVGVVALLAAGCIGSPFEGVGTTPTGAAEELVAGETSESIRPGAAAAFEVQVPAGMVLEVSAEPSAGATLGVEVRESPSGATFRPTPGAKASSRDRSFEVEPIDDGDKGTGFRFLGRSATGGLWRIAVTASPAARREALLARTRSASTVENLLLLGYLLSGQATANRPPAFLLTSYPELDGYYDEIAIRLSIRFLQESEVPAPSGDGGSSGDPNAGAGDPNAPGGASGVPTRMSALRIAQTGDAVPGQPGAAFTYFSNPIVDTAGRVAFWGAYVGGVGSAGLYVFQNGALERVIDDDPNARGVVTGLGPDATFGDLNITYDLGSPHAAWGAGGRLIFAAPINGSPLPNALFRWRAGDRDLLRVTDESGIRGAFTDVGDTFLSEFMHPSVSDAGIVTFANRYTYFTTSEQIVFRNRGLFTSNGLTNTVLFAPEYAANVAVPGQPSAARFSDVELLGVISASGQVYFQASYSGGEGSRGLYRAGGGQLTRIVDNAPGRAWPGLPAGTRIGEADAPFDAFAVNEAGQLALDARVTQGGATRDAVLLFSGSTWRELRAASSLAGSDLLSGLNRGGALVMLAGQRPYLVESSTRTVDLSARPPAELAATPLLWETFGGAINNNGRALVRYRRTSDGAPGLAFWNGERLLLVADAALGVAGLESPAAGRAFTQVFAVTFPRLATIDRSGVLKDRPETDLPGRSGALNDADEAVLRVGSPGDDGAANTADDYQAIFLSRAR